MGRPPKGTWDEATTDRLLKAAIVEFGRGGYRAARLEDIASAADVRRPSLLYHFGSKQALYDKVVTQAFTRLAAALAPALDTAGAFEQKLASVVAAMLTFEAQHRPLMSIIVRELVEPHDATGAARRELSQIIDRLEDFVADQGTGTVPSGVPVRAAVMHLIGAHLLWTVAHHGVDRAQEATANTAAMASGVLLGRWPAA